MQVIFDIETDGFLEATTKIHSLEMGAVVNDHWQTVSCSDNGSFAPVAKGLVTLSNASELIGHNIICFDIPAIKKVYPSWNFGGIVTDTLLMSRMLYPDIVLQDMLLMHTKPVLFAQLKEHDLIGKHSLEAWGFRLGVYKGDYGKTTDWKEWTPEMQRYCKQDVVVTKALYDHLSKKYLSKDAYNLEVAFQEYVFEQEQHGCYFDVGKAIHLKQILTFKLDKVREEIDQTVPSWTETELFIPKKSNKTKGYIKGVTVPRTTTTKFNPNSRMQIEKFLKNKYDWEPSELTKTGRAKINDEILDELDALDWSEAKLFAQFLTYTKLMGYISEGDNAWLKLARNGKLHGRIITCGAITRRCTHSTPNLGQVPSVKKLMGKECRALFYAPTGFNFVGADMSGVELRCFAHYLAAYDHGAYVEVVMNGDIHTRNQQDAGLPTRDNAKTFIYAALYGAGDAKIGSITRPQARLLERQSEGKRLKENFKRANPAYDSLIKDLKNVLKTRGYIYGIDKHALTPRAAHSALNTLLQNCGAVLMKRATVFFKQKMVEKGWWLSKVFPVLHVHDELQCLVSEELDAHDIGKAMVQSMNEAGKYYEMKIPIDGEYKIGKNWMETH